MPDLTQLSATELVAAYRHRRLSPVEVIDAVLARLEAVQARCNAFSFIDGEGARRLAREAEARWQRGEPLGELDGVPVSIKDLSPVKGWPTLKGSLTVEKQQPWDVDAPTVARLKEAGAVLFAKTTTPEFGWKGFTDSPGFGITRNPWDLGRTSGGSSGGAGVAVAAGVGPLALGSDGGGSVRIPAAWCGIFGLKPTTGRIPDLREGGYTNLTSAGPMARTVADAALMLNVLAKPDPGDWYSLPPDGRDGRIGLEDGVRGLRLAWSQNLGDTTVDADIAEITAAAARQFEALGAHVEAIGAAIPPLRPIFEPYWLAQMAAIVRRTPAAKRHQLDPDLVRTASPGTELGADAVLDGINQRAELWRRFAALHERYDLLLTPTMARRPPPVETAYHTAAFDRWHDAVPFTVPFNLTGQPAASIPCGMTADGLPVGLQIVGPRFGEAHVLRAARAFESVRGPHTWPIC